MLCWGYLIPFSSLRPLSPDPVPFISYSSGSTKGKVLFGQILSLINKGSVELAPPSPGFYSHLFIVWKALGSWRPIIDLSLLNKFVLQTKFKMETNQSVFLVVRRSDWVVSIDLKDAYLQVLVHPGSRRYLHFMAFGKIYHFKVLCFGLSTAPQVFTRVMAPVSAMLHSLGVWILRYLCDWLVLASSQTGFVGKGYSSRSLSPFRHYHQSRQITPFSFSTYLGMVIQSQTLTAFPSPERVSTLLLQIEEFLSCRRLNVILWRSLLGRLSSLSLLVPGGRLRVRSPVSPSGLLGFSGRVRLGAMDSLHPGQSSVVVRREQSSCGGLPRVPDFGSSVLVRRFRPGLGHPSGEPICLGSLVSR